jgi:uncharacterized membrane protein
MKGSRDTAVSKQEEAIPEPRSRIILTLAFGLASIGCSFVLVLRILITGSYRYLYLIWNLFLAWIPYGLALAMVTLAAKVKSRRRIRFLIILFGTLWLIFYPNAPYILTDFIHIINVPPRISHELPFISTNGILWYDIVLNSSFAFIGHLIGLVSLVFFHNLTRTLYNRWVGWVIAIAASFLGGYGIFLGRFARLNSWHIFTKTIPSMKTIFGYLLNTKVLLFSCCFGFFIFLTYIVVYAFQMTRNLQQ